MHRAPVVREVSATEDGWIAGLGAMGIGIAALHLGAGRRTKEDSIDHAVGIVCRAKLGDRVERGDVLAEVHARGDAAAEKAAEAVSAAYRIGSEERAPRSIVLGIVR
jgi:pyrimidine-nucleoside phosphorylase